MIAATLLILALLVGLIALFHIAAVPHALAAVTVLVLVGLIALGARLP